MARPETGARPRDSRGEVLHSRRAVEEALGLLAPPTPVGTDQNLRVRDHWNHEGVGGCSPTDLGDGVFVMSIARVPERDDHAGVENAQSHSARSSLRYPSG